jgi:hypothetical protein
MIGRFNAGLSGFILILLQKNVVVSQAARHCAERLGSFIASIVFIAFVAVFL